MKGNLRKLSMLLLLSAISACGTRGDQASFTQTVSREQVLAVADKAADAQLEANRKVQPKIDWIWGAFYTGLAEYRHVSPGGDAYTQALWDMGNRAQWRLLTHPRNDRFHADDFCVAYAYLDLYAQKPDPAIMAAIKPRFDALADRLKTDPAPGAELTWWWCDALFMAPAAMVRMSLLTGDPKYIDAMDKEWWRTTAALYDQDEHLFYRDKRFIGNRSASGHKVFWSRGDGWVYAGLANLLTYMPKDYPTRPKYIAQFKELAARLATLQQADGTWAPSLLDAEHIPASETSGTAFYCYGTAWGINNGLLNKDKYLPVVAKAYAAMVAACRPDGLPGYVQAVSDRPESVGPQNTQLYATGGYLLASKELLPLTPLAVPPAPQLRAAATQPAATAPASATRPGSTVVQPLPNAKAFVRYVPERMDDIAWENDRIAFRIYGPALEKNEPTGSGIDVWVKRTREMFVNDMYRLADYHNDHGKGVDFYDVKQSRGCGGLGVWDNGKLYTSRVWQTYRILQNGPDLASFQVTYAPWDANGRKISEIRTIALAAGSNLNRVQSTLESDKPGDLIVGIGIAVRPGEGKLYQDEKHGILSYWQPADSAHGVIACGVVVDPAQFVGFAKDAANNLILIKVTSGKPFTYYAGAGWSQSGDFKDASAWEAYLKNFKRQ